MCYLSSCHHHIKIHPEHRKFLLFERTFQDGSTKYFQFCVLPFGLSSTCCAFTKVLRPFNKRWRCIGIKAVIYFYHGIVAFRSFEFAKIASELIKDVEKKKFDAKTKGKWLGIIIGLLEMTFTLPSEKNNELLAYIKKI